MALSRSVSNSVMLLRKACGIVGSSSSSSLYHQPRAALVSSFSTTTSSSRLLASPLSARKPSAIAPWRTLSPLGFASQRSVLTVAEQQHLHRGLEPLFSDEALEVNRRKYHLEYVRRLNYLTEGTEFFNMLLEPMIVNTSQRAEFAYLYNLAGQVWNYDFFWSCLKHKSTMEEVSPLLKEHLIIQFGGVDEFIEKFSQAAISHFGSGWVWLLNVDGQLTIQAMDNADGPLPLGPAVRPLLVINVWEHCYYGDYLNNRAKYVANFWKVVNWSFVSERLLDGPHVLQ